MASPSGATRRAIIAITATLAVYALAVMMHRGEFWPFSIYPMFARAGQPWTHALVVEIDPRWARDWGPWTQDDLPGVVFPTQSIGVSAEDLSQLIQLTASWTDDRVAVLRKLFGSALADGRTLMLVRGDGRLLDDVEVELSGLVVIAPDGHELNPRLGAAR